MRLCLSGIKFLVCIILLTAILTPAVALQSSFEQVTDEELLALKVLIDKERSARGLLVDDNSSEDQIAVWVTLSGIRYHACDTCSRMKNAVQISLSIANKIGYTPCKLCYSN